MNKEEDLSVRACRLYEELRRASLDYSILLREDDWKRIEGEVKVLKRTKAAISLARSRLYEKMTGTKGSGLMFDEFIRQL